jgi:transcriptional regulator with XRE-family HTH domain
VAHKSLTEQRRREVEELATTRRAHGHPFEDIAAEIIGIAGITRLWAWRLAKGWRRSELLERLRRLGDPPVDESMLWRWEIGERDPSKEHLDRLCQVYHTRPDLLGYGRDYSQPGARQDGAATNGQPSTTLALTVSMVTGALASEPLAMVEALTASTVSSETLTVLERAAVWHQPACQE